MAAMMPSVGGGSNQSGNPYQHYDAPSPVDDDLIDPDEGTAYLWCQHDLILTFKYSYSGRIR